MKMFRKTTLFSLAALLSLAVIPMVSTANEVSTPLDAFRAQMLQESNGDLTMMGTLTQYTPEGEITTQLSGEEIIAMLENTILNMPTVAGPGKSGAIAGSPNLAGAAPGWPFCDYASTFNIYFGGSPGSKFLTPRNAVAGGQGAVCGFGASAWAPIAMDTSSNVFSCSAGMVAKPNPSIPVGTQGGYFCGNGQGAAVTEGTAAVLTLGFGSLRLDYFMGLSATAARTSA